MSTWPSIFWSSLGSRYNFLFVTLSISCAFLLCNFTGFYQQTESSKEPASHPVLLNKKQIKMEEERLTTELQLMTRERNDLKDQLMILTEGTVDNRYLLFQTSWGCRQCQPHILPLKVLVSKSLFQTSFLNSSQGRDRHEM